MNKLAKVLAIIVTTLIVLQFLGILGFLMSWWGLLTIGVVIAILSPAIFIICSTYIFVKTTERG